MTFLLFYLNMFSLLGFRYVGMLTGFKLMAIALFLYNFFQLRRMEKEEEKAEQLEAETEALKITSHSVDSIDKRKEILSTQKKRRRNLSSCVLMKLYFPVFEIGEVEAERGIGQDRESHSKQLQVTT